MTEFILEAEGIKKSFAGQTACEVEKLAFPAGSITAVCGPNGAGKSTLLRLLALLDFPDQGRIRFKGRELAAKGDWFSARREVSMVDQSPFAFHSSVFHNVAYGLKLRGLPSSEQRERVAEALAWVGLAGFEKRRARSLSGGEVQRMVLARAMAISPALLILDEPTAHVDAARVKEIEQAIMDWQRPRGATIIMATHDAEQASRLCQTALQIERGKISIQ